ncbi:MAG: serine/threonine-protein kinase, partial [Myxococcota bacterium]
MTSTTSGEALARAAAFASVHRGLFDSDARARFGRFSLIRALGRGAHGRVYLAFDPTLEREVALKLIAAEGPAAVQRGLREGRALARIRHPNLVRIHDVVQQGDAIGLAMERIAGPTLRDWTRTRRNAREVIAIMTDVGRGLAALHAAGLVHRDVKPTNVVIDPEHGPCIIDLGLAHDVSEETTRRLRSGTPGYLAPEQLDGIEVGPAADQYAWSVMFWEALTGGKPLQTDANPAAIPRGVQRILRRGLASAPEQRFASVDAMLHELAACQRASRVRRLGAAALVAGVALAALQVAALPSDACTQRDTASAGRWSPAQSASLRSHLGALAAPTASTLARKITDELDADHLSLSQSERWVCEAQAAGQPMSDEAFCLQQAAAEFTTTVQALQTLDAASLPDGADMVARMVPPQRCQLRPAPQPEAPTAADLRVLARARGALQGVANACPLLGADLCKQRFAELEVDTASECGLEPVALFEQGRGLMLAGVDDEAFDFLTRAAWASEACGAIAL